MMNEDSSTELFMRSLAYAVGRGKSVASWARNFSISESSARKLTELPEFPALVEEARRKQAEKAVREVAGRTAKAIDALGAASQKKGFSKASLAEAKALLEKWAELTAKLDQGKEVADLRARIAMLEEARAPYVQSSASLAEAKVLLEKWAKLNAKLDQDKEIADLRARIAMLEEARATYIKIDLGGSRN
jgi:DNA repair exonuclease SbcCD ATPase subunit